MKIAIEYDDFSPVNHHLDLLDKMKEHYPNFKVTLFTVPLEVRWAKKKEDFAAITKPVAQAWVDAVNERPWIEIALHGLAHSPLEFAELSYEAAKKRITIGVRMLENKQIEGFTKIFKAPQWTISTEAKKAAEDMGFKVVEDDYYNWNLAMDAPNKNAVEPFIMHGHIQDVCENGMEETMRRVLSLPIDTEFMFLSEVFNAPKGEFDL